MQLTKDQFLDYFIEDYSDIAYFYDSLSKDELNLLDYVKIDADTLDTFRIKLNEQVNYELVKLFFDFMYEPSNSFVVYGELEGAFIDSLPNSVFVRREDTNVYLFNLEDLLSYINELYTECNLSYKVDTSNVDMYKLSYHLNANSTFKWLIQ
jgi:hypothetical protein